MSRVLPHNQYNHSFHYSISQSLTIRSYDYDGCMVWCMVMSCVYIYTYSNLSDLSSRLVSIMQKDEKREAAALLSPSRATSPKAKALAAAAASESKDKDKDATHDDHDDKRNDGATSATPTGIGITDEKPLSELAEEVFEDCGYITHSASHILYHSYYTTSIIIHNTYADTNIWCIMRQIVWVL